MHRICELFVLRRSLQRSQGHGSLYRGREMRFPTPNPTDYGVLDE